MRADSNEPAAARFGARELDIGKAAFRKEEVKNLCRGPLALAHLAAAARGLRKRAAFPADRRTHRAAAFCRATSAAAVIQRAAPRLTAGDAGKLSAGKIFLAARRDAIYLAAAALVPAPLRC